MGFTKPGRSPGLLVSSYLTFSPLPVARACWRSVFCGTFPSLTAGGRYPPSHPTEPGLSSRQNIFGTKIATNISKDENANFDTEKYVRPATARPTQILSESSHGTRRRASGTCWFGLRVRNQTQAAGKWCKTWRGNMQDSLFHRIV